MLCCARHVCKKRCDGLSSCPLLSSSVLLVWYGARHRIAQYPLQVHGKSTRHRRCECCIVIIIVVGMMTTTNTTVGGQRCHHSACFSSSSLLSLLLVGKNDPGRRNPEIGVRILPRGGKFRDNDDERQDETRITTTRILVSSAASIFAAAAVGIESAAAAVS